MIVNTSRFPSITVRTVHHQNLSRGVCVKAQQTNSFSHFYLVKIILIYKRFQYTDVYLTIINILTLDILR